ncbi:MULTISPECIES: hypothetical protein [unclassified Natrinema]|uniref:hypothetical protein n=1 Tax=unclassified Natrinema TaxID=2622230 RepID=UPI00026D4422|nr:MULTISPECIES: hypothetical protein [unclassified Natrinema]AFO56160.1 hypothetical protein NJ7G_0911 [Natrinema sp. J7-2]
MAEHTSAPSLESAGRPPSAGHRGHATPHWSAGSDGGPIAAPDRDAREWTRSSGTEPHQRLSTTHG